MTALSLHELPALTIIGRVGVAELVCGRIGLAEKAYTVAELVILLEVGPSLLRPKWSLDEIVLADLVCGRDGRFPLGRTFISLN